MMNPELLLPLGHRVFLRLWHSLHFRIALSITSLAVVLILWWNDGPPPVRPPCILKRICRWKKTPLLFFQFIKSWIYPPLLFGAHQARISASHLSRKLKGAILALQNARRLHIRKRLARQHFNKAFATPRVRFRKHNYVTPLLCLTSLLVSSASHHPAHDGIQIKANFDTNSLDFGVDNR